MGKRLFIAEKPSVAQEFAKALQLNMTRKDGYLESEQDIVTWCVGHLVTMSYPEAYDPKYKRWELHTLPFLPETYKYEVIPNVKKQFRIVASLLNRPDVETIYVCTDSGREGEYIYRLVEQEAGVTGKVRRRVWIDSQTQEEILRGVREAKDLSAYDSLSDAAYLRAKEDYLMGINFSRVLTLKYGDSVKNFLKKDRAVISVGRVMTCVLGMVVDREREIRSFVKTPFYRVCASFGIPIAKQSGAFEGEWRSSEQSAWFGSPLLYKENGFREKKDALDLVEKLGFVPPDGQAGPQAGTARLEKCEKKREQKAAPLLYNLAELQNDCSRMFKLSPDETLGIAQTLYEKKLTTYPRTDARVLSSAVAKEIEKNVRGLTGYEPLSAAARQILAEGRCAKIPKSRYVNDAQITDHYAIIPTGQGLFALRSLSPAAARVYEAIVRRFLSIFYPPAVYQKVSLTILMQSEKLPKGERFYSAFKVLLEEGYLQVARAAVPGRQREETDRKEEPQQEQRCDASFLKTLEGMKKGTVLPVDGLFVREGETSAPKRYNSGTMILTMENAGQFIEDEELRAQIKGSGIGTSATRAEILKKLVNIGYLSLNKKTQIYTPTQMGEMVYDVVHNAIRPLLNPALTASWEKGLTGVAQGSITAEEYLRKLNDFVARRTNAVKQLRNQTALFAQFHQAAQYYTGTKESREKKKKNAGSKVPQRKGET